VNVSPLPWWLVLFASASAAYLVLPLVFMGSRVPWDQFPAVLSSDEAADALSLSLKTCAAALAIDLVLGVPLAVALSRDWRGVGVLRVLVALPLALPPVVAGIALVAAFGRRGVLGSQLEAFGVTVAFTTAAVVLAQVFVSLPFLVVTLEAALRSRPRGLEETAASLGARPTRVLASVTLPMVVPGVARGAALALARCLGEFGATLTFAGSLQGITRTLPIQVYLARESADKTDLVLGIILVGVAALVVAATEMPARGRRRVREEEVLDDGGDDPAAVDASQSLQPVEKTAVPLRVEGRVVERGWDVSIDVGAGEVLAVMGHNGAGKSTLAEVLSGSLALDSGTVQIGDLTADAAGAFIPPRGRDVAMVSQNPRIFEHMTVLANVAFPLVCRGFPRAPHAAGSQTRSRSLQQRNRSRAVNPRGLERVAQWVKTARRVLPRLLPRPAHRQGLRHALKAGRFLFLGQCRFKGHKKRGHRAPGTYRRHRQVRDHGLVDRRKRRPRNLRVAAPNAGGEEL